MPSIDVMIPNYNYGRYLAECVESALAQPVEDLRVTIIDNRSTDDSVDVARALMQRDPRVRLVQNSRNLGPQASFNRAIDLASADYLVILSSDDALKPGVLAFAMRLLEQYPDAATVIGSHSERWYGEPVIEDTPEEPDWNKLESEQCLQQLCGSLGSGYAVDSIVVRTTVQRSVGHFRKGLNYWDDVEMFLRLVLRGEVIRVHGALARRRIHDSNLSTALWFDRLADLRETEAAFRIFFSQEGATCWKAPELQATAMRCLAARAYWSGVSRLVRGDRGGVDLIRYAISVDSRVAVVPPVRHLFRRLGLTRRIFGALADMGMRRSR